MIAVIGAGSWGTTFAVRLARREIPVTLYEHFPEVAMDIRRRRENRLFLPKVALPDSMEISNDLPAVVAAARMIFNAVPTQFIRGVYAPLRKSPGAWRGKVLVNLSKGIEIKSGKTISHLFRDLFPSLSARQYAALSGPTHAEEVIRDIPTTAVVAGPPDLAVGIQRLVSDRLFRLYTNPDVLGVELAGALKNCIAVAAGVCAGLGFGDNTQAAILTRGLAEIMRLGTALGARRETFAGLAGIGDLAVTCGSRHSRNRRYGELLARGQTPRMIEKKYRFVAEGVPTSVAAVRLARTARVEVPIIREVYNIVYRGRSTRRAVEALLSRPVRPERI
ncbi:NAD(P)-dependent glycerol-3-phosphate dehydrogenase [bacterium]|nr:NAD(P)-dependent glycerol-3-phosphate dehydrogenase [bacterium]